MAEGVSPERARRNVILTAVVAGLAGLLFGYDAGIIASALLFVKPDFMLSSFATGLVVATVPIGAAIGAVSAGPVSDRVGRRGPILVAAALFVVGSVISAAAAGTPTLVLGRLVIGLAIGFASASAPVYVSEIAPPALRGRLVSLFQLSVTVGILVAYGVGLAFEPIDGWRWMLGLGVVPAILLAIGVTRLPRSPRWLVMAGQEHRARVVLRKLRATTEEGIDRELDEIKLEVAEETAGGWRELRAPAVRAAMLVGIGVMTLSAVTGINMVIYYAPTIVQATGVSSTAGAIGAAVGVGLINVIMTVVALRYIDRVGRRPLLLVGLTVMTIALAALAISFLGANSNTFTSVLAVTSLMVYVGAYAIGLGPMMWLLNAEVYPIHVRGKAAGLGTSVNWVANFAVAMTFPLLVSGIGESGTFWIYAAISAFAVLFVFRVVPETRGRSLGEVQEIFRDRAGVT